MEMESKSSSSSKPLHHFALPDGLKWGNHKFSRCMKVNSNGKISTVVRRPSSSSSSAEAASFSTRVYNNSDRFLPSGLGKCKEREEFIDRPSSPAAAAHRRRSDFKKSGFDFKNHPAPSLDYIESYRKLKSIKSFGGEHGGGTRREGDGIAAVREKIMFDLQTEAVKMKNAILRNGLDTSDQVDDSNHTPPVPSVSPANNSSPSDAIPSWNLRTRRAACKALQPPNGAGTSCVAGGNVSVVAGQGLNYNAMISDPKYPSVITEKIKTPRQQRSGGATTSSNKANERAKFSVTLTKHEIEDDFLAFTGRRPHRRPRKRPRYIQKGLDTLFPGLWLTEITADMYKVVEKP